MRVRVLGQYLHTQVVVLAILESVLFAVCLYAAYALRFWEDLSATPGWFGALVPTAVVFAIAVTLSFFALGMYTTRQRARFGGLGLRVLVAVIAALIAIASAFYFFPELHLGRGVMVLAAFLSVFAAMGSRYAFSHLIDNDMLKKRVLVYGDGQRLRIFEKLRRRSDRRGYLIVGVVGPGSDLALSQTSIIENPSSLRQLCEELSVDEMVVALEDRRGILPQTALLECRLAGINVIDLMSFLERETGRIYLDVVSPGWMIFNQGFKRDGLRQFSSRALDILASAALLTLTLPIMLVVAGWIWLEGRSTGGGIFYRQERVGYEGRVFSLLKFRSMRVDAEKAGKPQWAQKNDARVTRIGAFIRRTRIDELPQLLNVLQGHMSFVGPRPERPHFVTELAERIPYYGYRHSVKPGITGWAQLCYPYGASEQDAMAKLQYDLYYVKNNSLLFDLGILVQTAEVVFLGKGAR